MFQTIAQQRVSNRVLLAVAAALLSVSVVVALQLAALNAPSIQPRIQAPQSGPTVDYDSPHVREFRAGQPF